MAEGKEVPRTWLNGTVRCDSWNLNDVEIDNVLAWLEGGHLDTLKHRLLATFHPKPIAYYQGSASGIGTNSLYQCSCGTVFDATDYGSW